MSTNKEGDGKYFERTSFTYKILLTSIKMFPDNSSNSSNNINNNTTSIIIIIIIIMIITIIIMIESSNSVRQYNTYEYELVHVSWNMTRQSSFLLPVLKIETAQTTTIPPKQK